MRKGAAGVEGMALHTCTCPPCFTEYLKDGKMEVRAQVRPRHLRRRHRHLHRGARRRQRCARSYSPSLHASGGSLAFLL